ncbi:hypothetical protein CRG98_021332 [Punica granatum]|uniref:Uncharacterized protein n=1 Tax=Punica granatum TaxID=22663 RepID=A0A2I0JQS3_PUNGR|nr:hypothetical protein CRG98_021332 [Punica granatum]
MASRVYTFEGFLTTLTLPRGEVVTCREPINRARLLFSFLFLYRVSQFFFHEFLLGFPVCSSLGAPRADHEHLQHPLGGQDESCQPVQPSRASRASRFLPGCQIVHLGSLTTHYCTALFRDSSSFKTTTKHAPRHSMTRSGSNRGCGDHHDSREPRGTHGLTPRDAAVSPLYSLEAQIEVEEVVSTRENPWTFSASSCMRWPRVPRGSLESLTTSPPQLKSFPEVP